MTKPHIPEFASAEEEPSIEELIATQKERMRVQNPERLAVLERYFAIGEKYKLFSPLLVERYHEIEEDWFNIADYCDRFGDEIYRQVAEDCEAFIAKREQEVQNLKTSLREIGVERLRIYMKMLEEDGASSSPLRHAVYSTDFSYLDTCEYEKMLRILELVHACDTSAVDLWEAERVQRVEKERRDFLKKEKGRILLKYQRETGKVWQVIALLCQRMRFIDSAPANTHFLSGVSAENLVLLEHNFKKIESKLRTYGLDIYEASAEDWNVVCDEILGEQSSGAE